MEKTKTVLITGIGGAIGSHMLRYVLNETHWNVVGVDSFNHKGHFDRIVDDERVTIIRHDLTAPFTDRQVDKIGHVDYIINLASLSDVQASIDDPAPFIRNNVELMTTVLELARKVKPTTFLHFSTDEVYGPADIHEGHPEWDTILPSNPYAASKAAQEAIAIAYWRSYGVPLIITNTMNNFGEMQSPSKFPAMIQKKLAAGEKVTIHAASDGTIGTRHYLHSYNAADAVVFILTHVEPHLHEPGHIDYPERLNIVGDRQVSNLELAQEIASLMGKELDYEIVDFHSKAPGHDLHYGLTGHRLAYLGWHSPMSFEDSLLQTINWQQANPEWMA